MQQLPFWPVCRVLANRPRLKILGLLSSSRPGLRVSALPMATKLSQPTASQYLRPWRAAVLWSRAASA